MSEDFPTIGGDENDVDVWPFLYFKLYDYDTGSLTDRVKTAEFIKRKPSCVKSLTELGAEIEITNSGHVASDLVIIEWRVVFCTYEGHLPHEGFSISHYAETGSDPVDEMNSLDFIAANSAKTVRIAFPTAPLSLKNIYLQARVSLLWEPEVPMSAWDFTNDIRVTEAHREI